MKKNEMVKESLVETGKKLGSGVVGMLIGSAVGRPSLLVGIVTIQSVCIIIFNLCQGRGELIQVYLLSQSFQ